LHFNFFNLKTKSCGLASVPDESPQFYAMS
jgi:hypothetical protein